MSWDRKTLVMLYECFLDQYSQAEMRLNVFTDHMDHQAGTHIRKRYVRLAVADMKMAAGDFQRIVIRIFV